MVVYACDEHIKLEYIHKRAQSKAEEREQGAGRREQGKKDKD